MMAEWRQQIPKAIEATMIIHNLCIDHNTPLPERKAVPDNVRVKPADECIDPPNGEEKVVRSALIRYAMDHWKINGEGNLARRT